jgi:hypothetical protein
MDHSHHTMGSGGVRLGAAAHLVGDPRKRNRAHAQTMALRQHRRLQRYALKRG